MTITHVPPGRELFLPFDLHNLVVTVWVNLYYRARTKSLPEKTSCLSVGTILVINAVGYSLDRDSAHTMTETLDGQTDKSSLRHGNDVVYLFESRLICKRKNCVYQTKSWRN